MELFLSYEYGDRNKSAFELEAELWDSFQRLRSVDCKNKLIVFYLPLARIVSAQLYAKRVSDEIAFEDFLQYARVGLIEAIDRYQPDRGVKFSSFADRRIRGAILNEIEIQTEKQQQVAMMARIRQKNEEEKNKKEKIIQEEVSLSGESGLFPEEPKTPSASNDEGKLYSKMVDLYFNWFKDLNGGIPPKFGKADGSAMKQIINYFKYIHKQANNGKDEVEEVILMFTYILTNWAKIDPFLQKQTKLIQINGNIQNIINDLKNGKRNSTSKSDKSEHARTSRVQDAFGKIDDIFNSK